jgi:hypothetical protein
VQSASPRDEFPFDTSGLDRLTIHRYRIELVACERVVAPPNRLPNMLRGAFEIAFRRLVCHDLALDCEVCPLLGTCPYPAVFRPVPPENSNRLSKAQDLPRPFVFEAPLGGGDVLEAGHELEIGLTIFGSANRWLPYLVVALRAFADRGLGPTRGRLRLVRVTAVGASGRIRGPPSAGRPSCTTIPDQEGTETEGCLWGKGRRTTPTTISRA